MGFLSIGCLDMTEAQGRVVAVLGPTNTGKTWLAIERMLGHRSGMIGFPLRLLARENYDRIVSQRGLGAVALITGEEIIAPPAPQYFVCTVEAMPVDRAVAFLAVDEIQLCADPERGHVFTDRLLHARGLDETMFLGAETIRPLIHALVPRVSFVSRPRFSQLSYAGYKKLTRLPPRSAVVAFSATEVYELAETLRRQRGGTAVVLGALSPRTRNAQVVLYQAGEVDYLVATDAIGMGLNMDVDHVAFARLTKFDGRAPRRLRAPEVAQIAGRAGRHRSDGTFGTTEELKDGLEPELTDAVENHVFPPLKAVMWRNHDLRFDSPGVLLQALDKRPPRPDIMFRARDSDDYLALETLARDPEIGARARGIDAVRLLWEVCRIPDFRKVLSDAHTRLLGQIYMHLTAHDPRRSSGGRLPVDWVSEQVTRLDRVEGDIDALVARLAHIRTWTYISHHPRWINDAAHWQERTRSIEDKLSDALHERLIQRFIDRRSASLARSLRSGGALLAAVRANGEVLVEGQPIGEISGLRFVPDCVTDNQDGRSLMSAARRALSDEIARRVHRLEEDVDDNILLTPETALVSWRENERADPAPIGRLTTGPRLMSPCVSVLYDDLLDSAQCERVRKRIERRIQSWIADRLAPLIRLQDAPLTGAARGLAFQLAEGLGSMMRRPAETLLETLDKEQRKALQRCGVVFGAKRLFLPILVKPRAVEARGLLWRVHFGQGILPLPPPGRSSVVRDAETPEAYYEAIGYPVIGMRAARVDLLDRFERELYKRSRAHAEGFVVESDLAPMIGCTAEEAPKIIIALGYKAKTGDDGIQRWKAPDKWKKQGKILRPQTVSDTPFAILQTMNKAK
ncbi:ATP-dependent RNA helicase SUPV3L1/SUV3 [Azospirillaceae bacterium]